MESQSRSFEVVNDLMSRKLRILRDFMWFESNLQTAHQLHTYAKSSFFSLSLTHSRASPLRSTQSAQYMFSGLVKIVCVMSVIKYRKYRMQQCFEIALSNCFIEFF